MSSLTHYFIHGQLRPAAEQITCTYGDIDNLMAESATVVRTRMNRDIDHLNGELNRANGDVAELQENLKTATNGAAAVSAELADAHKRLQAKPARPEQVKNAHNSVKTAVKVARAGLLGAAWAFFAGTLNQIPSIVAMGWCGKQQGPGAKAECYTTGVTAILVGVCAGVAGIYALKGSYAQYVEGTSHDPDNHSAN